MDADVDVPYFVLHFYHKYYLKRINISTDAMRFSYDCCHQRTYSIGCWNEVEVKINGIQMALIPDHPSNHTLYPPLNCLACI